MPRLSKSKLIAFRQCPKRLWLELNKPELRDDSGSQAAFNIKPKKGSKPKKRGMSLCLQSREKSTPALGTTIQVFLLEGDPRGKKAAVNDAAINESSITVNFVTKKPF